MGFIFRNPVFMKKILTEKVALCKHAIRKEQVDVKTRVESFFQQKIDEIYSS